MKERISFGTCLKLCLIIWRQAAGERYPSRMLEYFFAFYMMAWSGRVLWPGDMLVGAIYASILQLATEWFWGISGVLTSLVWIVALLRNGGWARSPVLRMVCSFLCTMWWWVLFVLYTASVNGGAPDFPSRMALPIAIVFAAYCVWRNAQDYAEVIEKQKILRQQQRDVVPAAGVPGNAP